ncbi:hypothetical protein SAMN05443246_5353 [Paenibacillus sp. GP183]|nr:hypothetical protein SAMN05443246_5353 [Paenibacillus sp. GP183]
MICLQIDLTRHPTPLVKKCLDFEGENLQRTRGKSVNDEEATVFINIRTLYILLTF